MPLTFGLGIGHAANVRSERRHVQDRPDPSVRRSQQRFVRDEEPTVFGVQNEKIAPSVPPGAKSRLATSLRVIPFHVRPASSETHTSLTVAM